MDEISTQINLIENQIEQALWGFEMKGELDKAHEIYLEAEDRLGQLKINGDDPSYKTLQRVLSYCLMRQGNILRQKGKPQDASALGMREIVAARISGDEITLARSLISNGTNLIVAGNLAQGLKLVEESRHLFENKDDHDHIQGLGWYWILLADLANARIVSKEPADVIEYATNAIALLKPIENWPGVARAYAARAVAAERLGDLEQAAEDRKEQAASEKKIVLDD